MTQKEAGATVSPEEIADFEDKGFVVVDNLLSDAETEVYGKAVDAALTERTKWDKRKLEERSRYEQSFRQCINLWEDAPEVRPLTFHPLIGEAAAKLLGAQAVRIWHDQALYKEAGGRETAPHLDHDYWAINEPRTITAWIPFDGSTLENGAMGYVPGSHKFDVTSFANIFTDEGFDLKEGVEARGVAPEFVEIPRGSVAFHHGRSIHLANPNLTEKTRRVHTMIFFADGCTRKDAKHPAVDRAGIEIGAPIQSNVTPVAWPLIDGKLPEPPPLPNPLRPGWPGWPAAKPTSD